jgi:hypothetical protein
MGTHSTSIRIPAPLPLVLIRPEWGKPRLRRSGLNDQWLCTSRPYGERIYAYAPDPVRAYQGWAQLAEWHAQNGSAAEVERKRGWFFWRK